MRYLDAKKKLIFMMATVKYLKLYFENKTTITDDDINTLVIKSLPIVFKDYDIGTEDITEITGKIKSLVINFRFPCLEYVFITVFASKNKFHCILKISILYFYLVQNALIVLETSS